MIAPIELFRKYDQILFNGQREYIHQYEVIMLAIIMLVSISFFITQDDVLFYMMTGMSISFLTFLIVDTLFIFKWKQLLRDLKVRLDNLK